MGIAFVILLLPVFIYIKLTKNKEYMDKILFTRKFGSLYDGFNIRDDDRRNNAIRHTTWFCVRRLLFALVIV